MGQLMGSYVPLVVGESTPGALVIVKVLAATAERFGWSDAFPSAWDLDWQQQVGRTRRPIGAAVIEAATGGKGSRITLEGLRYPSGPHVGYNFRASGSWTRAHIQQLADATVPPIHRLRIGSMVWRPPAED